MRRTTDSKAAVPIDVTQIPLPEGFLISAVFAELAGAEGEETTVEVKQGRQLLCRSARNCVALFSFDELGRRAVGTVDYLALS